VKIHYSASIGATAAVSYITKAKFISIVFHSFLQGQKRVKVGEKGAVAGVLVRMNRRGADGRTEAPDKLRRLIREIERIECSCCSEEFADRARPTSK